MKLADIAESIHIDPRKLTHYVLDTDSPHGKHKAVLFDKLLGFTKENHIGLLRQLEGGAMHAEVTFHTAKTNSENVIRRTLPSKEWKVSALS